MEHRSPGRRERAKHDKRERIMLAAKELFAAHGVGGVTTQQIADQADVAIGTLYLYAATKAELLIMVQNHKFGAAIDGGPAAAAATGTAPLESVLALVTPVVRCVREHVENGRTYLHELVFGDPTEPYRREGLALAARLELGIADLLVRDASVGPADASALARVVTAIIHIATTATLYLRRTDDEVLGDIREQVRVILAPRLDGSRRLTEGPRPTGPLEPPGAGLRGLGMTAKPSSGESPGVPALRRPGEGGVCGAG